MENLCISSVLLKLIILVFVLALMLVIHDRIKYRHIYNCFAKFPGPIKLPLIGCALDFWSINVIVENFMKLYERHGDIFATWCFRVPIVFVCDPKYLKILLNHDNCLDKDDRYRFTHDVFGNGLLTAPAKLWKKNRKIINPTFNQKILDSFVHIFIKHGQLMVEDMEKKIDKNHFFDIDQFALPYVMDIVAETAMGVENKEIKRSPDFVYDMNRISQIIVERTFKVWLHPNYLFRISQLGCEFYRLYEKLKTYLDDIVLIKHSEFYLHKNDPSYFDEKKRKPFLEHLLSIENEFSMTELTHEVAVFLTAGTDTTAATLGYVLVSLGAHKFIQEKVAAELHEVFGNDNRPICIDDLRKLQYLERVIKETMRIYPTVPFFARTATEDIDLDNYIIPKGASVVIPVIAAHHNKRYWPNPVEFDPDRFLPLEIAKRHPYCYLPFSSGPRNCIGFRKTICHDQLEDSVGFNFAILFCRHKCKIREYALQCPSRLENNWRRQYKAFEKNLMLTNETDHLQISSITINYNQNPVEVLKTLQ